jgi:hypothetical protein
VAQKLISPVVNMYILSHMKVEEIAETIVKLPPDHLARFRRWFAAFEAGRADHAKELDSTDQTWPPRRSHVRRIEKTCEGTMSFEDS